MISIGRLSRILFLVFSILIIAFILFLNLRIQYSSLNVQKDIIYELRGVRSALDNHADEAMQHIYPEGYVFMNAIYGLAWGNFLENTSRNTIYFKEGHEQIQKAWNRINSDAARITFDKDLLIPYGAFYTGWNTYLLGKKLSLERMDDRDSLELFLFKQQCKLIAKGIKQSVYPSSYNGQSWPADAMVCMAALALHDQLLPNEYGVEVNEWMKKVKDRLDSNGLIPHSVDGVELLEPARGSSQSLMLIFLRDIDPQFGSEQFTIYKNRFLDKRFGLLGIKEYPIGKTGNGDIDSGPVLFDMGAVATIVGMHTLNCYGDRGAAMLIQSEIETFGFPFTDRGEKGYLFGQLPMADVFIVWGHSSVIEYQSEITFMRFHLYSLMIIVALLLLLWPMHNKRFSFYQKK